MGLKEFMPHGLPEVLVLLAQHTREACISWEVCLKRRLLFGCKSVSILEPVHVTSLLTGAQLQRHGGYSRKE